MSGDHWKIHKFGGSSLADADCFARVGRILAAMPHRRIGVVVSAMRGTTDSLLRLTALAERDASAFSPVLTELGEQYARTAKALVDGERLAVLLDAWGEDAKHIAEALVAVAAARSAPQRTRDVVAGYGELWSARLLAAHLAARHSETRGGTWLDARRFIVVRHGDLGPTVLWDTSRKKLAGELDADFSGIAVVTGFIASDEEGLQTTLGRNGSDYSAAILAALTGADELDIWTDVDGVMSADPQRVPDAHIIESLSYNEALELAYFGAKVIHPQTLGPVIDNGIPVVIRNSFDPAHPGSRIGGATNDGGQIKGITAISGMALVNVEGTGMIGVPGTADRLFAALRGAGVSVTLISQASSEHSICIAVPAELAGRARDVISEAFAEELAEGQIESVDVTGGQSIVAVVGDGMAGHPGVAAKFFGTLGRAGINVRAIAQGSSERNISAVIDSDNVTRALRAVHSGFYLSAKTISIGVIGPGVVGGELLAQIERQTSRLRDSFNLDLRVRGIARSKKMLLGARRIDLSGWRAALDADGVATDLDAFVEHIQADHLPHAVILDCTAEQDIAGRYAEWLARGIHVITPNKKAFSGEHSYYRKLKDSAREGNAHCLYETTVGAALPIVKTLRDLVDTGDRIRSIAGIFSGTLAYLFNLYDGSRPFSEIVREARESGYTEPDPRDDLSGMDVARKLTILARELGQPLEIGGFRVENLVPPPLREGDVDAFLDGLSDYDGDMLARYEAARGDGCKLRYIGQLNENGEASVGLQAIPDDDAFANTRLTDNIVTFQSERYAHNPLVILGPGAGPEVTAGGVFGDLLKLVDMLDHGR